jgi:Putative Actinobacterial Holin-X, holin superfamily III
MSDLTQDARSISRLLGGAFEQLAQLVQTEIRLAKAELADKAAKAGMGVGLVFGGLLLMVPALVLFLIALALFLTNLGLSPVTAHLLAGAIGAGASAVLLVSGLARLKPSGLMPDTTIRQIQKDIAAAKEIAR